MSSTIRSTRRGFLYQDRFAILTFLELIQAQKIKSIYVDYPLSGQKSLDVKIILLDGTENIYEVKTGENFASDKRKKASSEVRDAFLDIKSYSDPSSNVNWNLILSKNLTGMIDDYVYHLKTIQRSLTYQSSQTKESSRWMKNRLQIPGIHSAQDLYNFIKTIKISFCHSDSIDNINDPYPEIDDLILCKINDLANDLMASQLSFELPSELLLYKLLHRCRDNAGTGNDLITILIETIADFFAQRKVLTKYERKSGNFDNLKKQSKKEIVERLSKLVPINSPKQNFSSLAENL